LPDPLTSLWPPSLNDSPPNCKLLVPYRRVNYHRRRRWLDNVYLEGTLLLVPDQF
jgi:hypothetical protein